MPEKTLAQNLVSFRWWLEGLNKILANGNLRIDTLTAARAEQQRLARVAARGGFKDAVFPLPRSFTTSRHQAILDELPKHRARFDTFASPEKNDVGYRWDNPYYRSPDAEVLYGIMRRFQPARVLEVGCGHSTRITRQAIRDGAFPCHVTCIDPWPRQEVSNLADTTVQAAIEEQDVVKLAASLRAGDVFFIDTSHILRAANDVACIYGALLPLVPAGTIVHVHDIFLPYEYPEKWLTELGCGTWGEQALVQALLMQGDAWDVLWPGHWLQRTLPDFARHFPHLRDTFAQSLWMVKKSTPRT